MPRTTMIDDELNHWIDLGCVNSVAFSYDNKWVASGSGSALGRWDNSIRLWCIEDSSKNQILQGHTSMYVR